VPDRSWTSISSVLLQVGHRGYSDRRRRVPGRIADTSVPEPGERARTRAVLVEMAKTSDTDTRCSRQSQQLTINTGHPPLAPTSGR